MFELNGKYTNAIIYADICEQEAISQIYELCNHPAFEGAKIRIMPDCHSGEGCVIGTTAILKEKKIIPSVVGCDIGCGVLTTIFKTDKDINFKELDDFILYKIPNGFDIRETKHPKLSKELENLIKDTVKTLKIGNEDFHINSVQSLGGGNHYIEIGKIDNNTYALSVHTGSRNFGKKIYEYFEKKAIENYNDKSELAIARNNFIKQMKKEHRESELNIELEKFTQNFKISEKKYPIELSYIENEVYEDYIIHMLRAQKFAKENRLLIAQDILEFLNVEIVEQFDTIHNYIEQLKDKTIVIRKGSISAKKGEKVAIPLNMKDGVIIGIGKGNEDWNYSAPHGAGRLLSRSKAKESISMEDFVESMKDINSWSICTETLDESPLAYKPAESIIGLIKDTVDIINIVKPIYNFKAHAPSKSWAEIKKEEKERKKKKSKIINSN